MADQHRPRASFLLACCTALQLLRPVGAVFWLRATTLYGEFDLDVNPFLTAAQTGKPMTLTSWRECVDYDYRWRVARLGSGEVGWSFCSFNADFIDNYWSIRSSANPRMIDQFNQDLYLGITDPTRRPRIEFGELWDTQWNDWFLYLTMGTAARDSGNRIRWTAYRPVTARVREGSNRQIELLADGMNPTFEDLSRIRNPEEIDLNDLGGIALDTSGGTAGRTIRRYPGPFPAVEVKGKSDNDLQHGDFLVLQGGIHLQVCFQRMGTRMDDGTYESAIRPSFIEYYGDDRPPPEDRPDVVGCQEIVLRVYKDIDTRIEPIPPSPSQESQLIMELTGNLPVGIVQPNIIVDVGEGFSDDTSPQISDPNAIDQVSNARAESIQAEDSPYDYNGDDNNMELEQEGASQQEIPRQGAVQPNNNNIFNRFDSISGRAGLPNYVPRFLPPVPAFLGSDNRQYAGRGPASETDSIEELLKSDPDDEVLGELPRGEFGGDVWPWADSPSEGNNPSADFWQHDLEDNPFSQANRQNDFMRISEQYQPPLGQRGSFGFGDNAMSPEQQSDSRFSSPDIMRQREQRGQIQMQGQGIEEEEEEDPYWPIPEEDPYIGLNQNQIAVIRAYLYEQEQQRQREGQPQ